MRPTRRRFYDLEDMSRMMRLEGVRMFRRLLAGLIVLMILASVPALGESLV
jgi:uncharacterized protein involved in cysteine biosynthesis